MAGLDGESEKGPCATSCPNVPHKRIQARDYLTAAKGRQQYDRKFRRLSIAADT